MTYSQFFETAEMIPEAKGIVVIEEREDKEPEATADELIMQLVTLGSYVNQLYVQSHLIHLNFEGPTFLAIHNFLKDQYENHIEQFDAIGEFVRSMDYLLPMCAKGLESACKKFDNVKSYEGKDMLTTYLRNLETAAFMAKDVAATAKEVKALDIENYLADFVGRMFKAAWFIKATLRS
jgi:DNA-binding ferritin-like protein